MLADSVLRRDDFRDVEAFCFFIGHARSGHSLVAALLNAHPNVVISNQVGAVRSIELGVPRALLYAAILRKDRRFSLHWQSTTAEGYEYGVPNRWQGRFEKIAVIGDKRAARSARRLAGNPPLLDKVRETVGVPLRVIQVTRNPFDTISTMSRRDKEGLEQSADRFFAGEKAIEQVRAMLAPGELWAIRHEDLIADPEGSLKNTWEWLSVPALPECIRDAASIVKSSPHKTRNAVSWTTGLRAWVEEGISRVGYLAGYSFED
ncbi:MAG: sulfotransferase [Actinomycetota bacterium]